MYCSKPKICVRRSEGGLGWFLGDGMGWDGGAGCWVLGLEGNAAPVAQDKSISRRSPLLLSESVLSANVKVER